MTTDPSIIFHFQTGQTLGVFAAETYNPPMHWLSLSLALSLFQTAAPPQKPQGRGSVTGFIIKMGSAEPVSKAVVTIGTVGGAGRAQADTATTGSGGQFAFQNREPGQYRLSATRSGYVRMEYGARVPNRT